MQQNAQPSSDNGGNGIDNETDGLSRLSQYDTTTKSQQ